MSDPDEPKGSGGIVTVQPGDLRFPVPPGEDILAGARRLGVRLRFGCREGGCGECLVQLLEGTVAYPVTVAESVLADSTRQDLCLPCRAVPQGDVTLRMRRGDQPGTSPFSNLLVERALATWTTQHRSPEEHMTSQPLARTTSLDDVTTVSERELSLVVSARETEADGVISLVLQDPDRAQLPEWGPGAHIDLVMGDNLIRQYSLCGPMRDRRQYRVGVLLDPKSRGGSTYVHEEIQQGSTVVVRGPRNHFPLVDAEEYLFIAGGIGITPMLPMIEYAEATGTPWRLVYGGRTRASMGFLSELEQFGERVSVLPQDETGMLPLDTELATPKPGKLVYSCGPNGLLDALDTACSHWPSGALHTERFAAKEFAADPDALETFEVVAQRSGKTMTVGPDQTILEACEAAGIKILASCRAGVCGTCDVDVLEGEPEHRDSVLSAEDRESNEYMIVCVSRSKSPRLVLDA